MLSDGMNSTMNFVFVVLVATQGIIGDKTTLNPIEGQTDDVLGLTTLSNLNGDDEDGTGTSKYTIDTTEEQTSIYGDNSSSSRISYAHEEPTENNSESTKIVRNPATTKEILEDLETSDGKITTDISHHSPISHTVEHSIRKDMSNNNEIEVNEKNASDKRTTNKTPDNATLENRYVIVETTTEPPYRERLETTAMNYNDDEIDDYFEKTTDQDTEKGTKDFLNEDDDVDVPKFYRRMFQVSHPFEESNNKPETEATTSKTITSIRDHSPLIHTKKSQDKHKDNSRSNHNENNRQPYESHSRLGHQAKSQQQSYDERQNYPTPVPPLYVDTQLDPHLNSRHGHLFTAQPDQSGSFENERRFPQAGPQFNNNRPLISNHPQLSPPQFIQQPFEQLPLLQPPMDLYHPQPQQQQHQSMQVQYPWPTVQPVPNHMDNILASLQQASLHPVLSAKQYKDFYEKQYIYPSNLF